MKSVGSGEGTSIPARLKSLLGHRIAVNAWLMLGSLLLALVGFFRTSLGQLSVALMFYFVLPLITPVTPLTPKGLLLEFSELPSEVQITLATSTLAFMGALYAGAVTWRRTKATEIKLDAANEIQKFFLRARTDLIQIEIQASDLEELRIKQLDTCLIDDACWTIRWISSQTEEIATRRKRVSAALSEVHTLRESSTLIFAQHPIAGCLFDKANEHFSASCHAMHFYLPDPSRPIPTLLLEVSFADSDTFGLFKAAQEQHLLKMSAYCGGCVGALRSEVFRPGVLGWIDPVRSYLRARQISAE